MFVRVPRRFLSRIKHAWFLQISPSATIFFLRAERLTRSDERSREMLTNAEDFARVIKLARGRQRVVELGTASGTTTLGLALDNKTRRIWTYDPYIEEADIARFIRLAPRAWNRVTMLKERGDQPSDPPSGIDFVFIDTAHTREDTVSEFRTWEPRLVPGGVIAFHDFNPQVFPGVVAAIREDLDLDGYVEGHDIFVWMKH